MRKGFFLFIMIAAALCPRAQKQVAAYPFEYSRNVLGNSDYGAYFLQDEATNQFMFVLRDAKKAEYILFNDKFKKVASLSPENGLKNTIFHFDKEEYLGGTAANGKFNFVYKVMDKKFLNKNIYYQIETVDLQNKSISNRQLFEIPNNEKLLLSFGNFGQYYSITANNKEDELTFYGLTAFGESFVKTVKVKIPPTSSKKKLADYLENMQFIPVDSKEEPGLELVSQKVKLFHTIDKITIIVNESDDPTQLITINTKDFSVHQTEVDHSSLTKDEKGKSYVNSFLFHKHLYSLVLNKKNIRFAIYDSETGTFLKSHEINENSNTEAFAAPPVMVMREGGMVKEKNIDNIRKLIKSLDKGTEGIMLTTDSKGRLLLTIGTYDMIQRSYTPMPETQQFRYETLKTPSGHSTIRAVPVLLPGKPMYTHYMANYYTSMQFKLLIDPVTLNLVKGAAPVSVNDQIKDYMDAMRPKAQATNQFTLNGKQYMAFYDRLQREYLIEEIRIRN